MDEVSKWTTIKNWEDDINHWTIRTPFTGPVKYSYLG